MLLEAIYHANINNGTGSSCLLYICITHFISSNKSKTKVLHIREYMFERVLLRVRQNMSSCGDDLKQENIYEKWIKFNIGKDTSNIITH